MVALCAMLMAACWYDFRKKKIPNLLILAMLVYGVGWRLWRDGATGGLFYLGQAAVVMIPMYFLFQIGVIGAGDVKLFGVTAGFLPFNKLFVFLFVSLLIAAMLSLFKLLEQRNLLKRMRHLFVYLADAVRNGWSLYPESGIELPEAGICLSGPILVGLLLYLGGVY